MLQVHFSGPAIWYASSKPFGREGTWMHVHISETLAVCTPVCIWMSIYGLKIVKGLTDEICPPQPHKQPAPRTAWLPSSSEQILPELLEKPGEEFASLRLPYRCGHVIASWGPDPCSLLQASCARQLHAQLCLAKLMSQARRSTGC